MVDTIQCQYQLVSGLAGVNTLLTTTFATCQQPSPAHFLSRSLGKYQGRTVQGLVQLLAKQWEVILLYRLLSTESSKILPHKHPPLASA